ncbi:wall-associated receptor kinase 3-like [Phalaenopsis equestris]|uniref:wall-associated receptor kinase 3-like n=1 Tax=Phalaenopsis equestris TaxID=78828 RepID=UPI0009E44AEA|nr:wall-associated receptor kinase 3-like [Phalaenopsis equestris]
MLPLLLPFFFIALSSSSSSPITLPGCPETCGNITIPFPFGAKPRCHLPGFQITCKNSSFPKPIISTVSGDLELFSISVSTSNATVLSPITRNCRPSDETQSIIDLSEHPFVLSSTRNKFTAVGCDTIALYAATTSSGSKTTFAGGCLPFCNSADKIVNGSCNGGGCCQTSIPNGLQTITTSLRSNTNNSSNSSDCNHAFFVEQDEFVFNPSYITNFSATSMPLGLDWAIPNGTCAKGNNMCGANAYCSESNILSGYICSCNSGFSGNPYLAEGCQDINECQDPSDTPCTINCQNTPGSFVCSCPRGYYGDGTKSGTGCSKSAKRFPLVQLVLCIGFSFLFLLLAASYLHWVQKKRKLLSLKEKYFHKNGGLLLRQHLAGHHAPHTETARIYTDEELKRATDNYSDARILGRGGNGIVYKGIFPDSNRAVAIKKPRCVDGSQIEPFINEVVLLSQVIHKHVVRILGCCLETQVPLLVYEYIPKGTLHHHLHNQPGSLSWEARLRIASETAGALAYLHSAIERPIFHRDVKSANILLDENYTAKVTDFGASRLLPLDRAQVTTLVQGTLGYLDPEYFQTGQLTEKSDVYGFGVVMAEMLTGEKPISSARMAEGKNLGVYFLARMKQGRLMETLEGRVRNEGSLEELMFVGEVTRRCLLMNGEDRPTMREVASELERVRRWGHGKSLWRAASSAASAAASGEEEDEGEWRCSRCKRFERRGSIVFGLMGNEIDRVCESAVRRESDSLLLEMANVGAVGSGSNDDSLDEGSMQTLMALDIRR